MNIELPSMKQFELPSEMHRYETEKCPDVATKRMVAFLQKEGYHKLALAVLTQELIPVSALMIAMNEQNYLHILSTMNTRCPSLSNLMHKPRLTLTGLSNTSIVSLSKDGTYLANVRAVNYILNEEGQFLLPKEMNFFQSDNLVLEIGNDLKTVIQEKNFKQTWKQQGKYRGIEDIRIFENKGTLHYIGTMLHENKLMMTFGEYDRQKEELEINLIQSPYSRAMEKNWCPFVNGNDEIHFVYQWHPLEIGKIQGDKLDIVHKKEYDMFFMRRLKGSSCGCVDPTTGKLWFLVHFHSEDTPRQYYHMFVVMDPMTYDILEMSCPFLFEGRKVEFGMGLIVEEERVIITYTVFDRDARIASFDKNKVMSQLFGESAVFNPI